MIKIHHFSILSIIALFFVHSINSTTIDFKNYEDTQQITILNKPKEDKTINEIINLDRPEKEKRLHELVNILNKSQQKDFSEELKAKYTLSHSQKLKRWTFLIYIAGDGNLYEFALRNIEQMKKIGSNSLFNIVIHFDYHLDKKPKKTRRFYVEKSQLLEVGTYSAMDSGNEKTLIDAAQWATTNYPSDYFGLVLWNHGSGDADPERLERFIDPAELFFYDATSNQILLDRTTLPINNERGICFDSTTGNYLNNQKLNLALYEITKMRNNSKIDILLLDACLMAGIGTACLVSKYARYMTASEELVPGTGYDYAALFSPLSTKFITAEDFAKHTVEAYNKTYNSITPDYTESAFNLSYVEQLAENSNAVADLILYFSEYDSTKSILKAVKLATKLCTSFNRPPKYIDLIDFYTNLLIHCSYISIKDSQNNDFYTELTKTIKQGNYLHKKAIIACVSGKNYPNAKGVSIYFPLKMSNSFENSFFGKKYRKWSLLVSLTSSY